MHRTLYVTTALLVTLSSRTAAESDLAEPLQPSDRDSVAPTDDKERTLKPLNLIEKLDSTLGETSKESEEAASAVLTAVDETASKLHHPGFSANIEATTSRIREDSATGKAALAINKRGQQLAHISSGEIVQKKQRLATSDSSASIDALLSSIRKERLKTNAALKSAEEIIRRHSTSDYSAFIRAPSQIRSSNDKINWPLGDQRRGNSNIREDLHLAERQPPTLHNKEVGPALLQHTAKHQSGLNFVEEFNREPYEGPLQIRLPVDPAELHRVKDMHEKFIIFQKLPCPQTLRETYKMMNIYIWHPYDSIKAAKRFEVLAKNMVPKDLESAISLDTMTSQDLVGAVNGEDMELQIFLKSDSSVYVISWVEDYRKMLREAYGYRLKLSNIDHGAVYLDSVYWMMLQKAYCLKSRIMYSLFCSFRTHDFALG